MKSFREIAIPLIKRGIPVIPVEPGGKRCLLPEWPARASALQSMVESWHAECPDYNVGCVGMPDGIVILDCDVKGLGKRIERETGQEFPDTLVVKSAGKGCYHFYFRQTNRSRAIGNRKVGDLFDLQSNCKYVVGPGSVLAQTGKKYEVVCDAELTDFPDWLGDWIEQHSASAKKAAACDMEPVNDDFDIEDMIEFFGLQHVQMGNWFNFPYECPVAGYQHQHAKLPGFFFDGQDLGWNCWASGCPSNGWNAGKVVKFLNEKRAEQGLEPYPHLIWPEQEPDWEAWGFPIGVAEMPLEDPGVPDDVDNNEGDVFGSFATPMIRPAKIVMGKDGKCSVVTAVPAKPKERDIVVSLGENPAVAVASAPARLPGLSEMPEDCMYGWLGDKTRELGVHLGFGYPAMLAMAAARVQAFPQYVRPTIYVCLIGRVHCGKSQAMERAKEAFRWTNDEQIIEESPYSDRGLAKQLAGTSAWQALGPSAWKTPEVRLFLWDEMNVVMKKMCVQGSTLSSVLCTLWSSDRAGGADKKSSDKVFSRLNIIGGIPVDSEQQFTEIFGNATAAGLYDRFVYGLSPEWNYAIPDIKPEARIPVVVQIPKHIYDMAHAWRDMDSEIDRKRLCEIALRIMVITAGINYDSTVTHECAQAALNFMTWQEAIRDKFKPSLAEPDKESRCTEAIRNAIMNWGAAHPDEEGFAQWRKQRTYYQKGNWYRYGAGTAMRCIKGLMDAEMIEQEMRMEDTGDGNEKPVPTGRIRWKGKLK
jgi:hypothetical protein